MVLFIHTYTITHVYEDILCVRAIYMYRCIMLGNKLITRTTWIVTIQSIHFNSSMFFDPVRLLWVSCWHFPLSPSDAGHVVSAKCLIMFFAHARSQELSKLFHFTSLHLLFFFMITVLDDLEWILNESWMNLDVTRHFYDEQLELVLGSQVCLLDLGDCKVRMAVGPWIVSLHCRHRRHM